MPVEFIWGRLLILLKQDRLQTHTAHHRRAWRFLSKNKEGFLPKIVFLQVHMVYPQAQTLDKFSARCIVALTLSWPC